MRCQGTVRAAKSDPKTVLIVGQQPGTESDSTRTLSVLYPRSKIEIVRSAEEAYLRLVRGGIDLVICEDDLPQGHKGLALWKLMETRGPSLPFILMAEKQQMQTPSATPGKFPPPVLVKPISAEALEGCVAEALRAQGTRHPAPPRVGIVAKRIFVEISFFSAQAPGRLPAKLEAFSFHPLGRGSNDLFAEKAMEIGQSVSIATSEGDTYSGKIVASRRAPLGRTLQVKPFPFVIKIEIT